MLPDHDRVLVDAPVLVRGLPSGRAIVVAERVGEGWVKVLLLPAAVLPPKRSRFREGCGVDAVLEADELVVRLLAASGRAVVPAVAVPADELGAMAVAVVVLRAERSLPRMRMG